jgi:DHA2 family multidrug resistance protein
MDVINPIHLRGWRFILLNGATGLANVVVLSNVPGYTILAPYAAGNFQGVTPSFGTWATSDHMVGLALGFPIARWLAARYGDYRVYGIALVAYAIISFFCATSDAIWSFVPMRFLLGLAGGVILPVGQAVLLGEYPPEQRTLGVGIWGLLSMMPFTIGVFMGGWYAEYLGWRTLFFSNVVIALTVAAVVGSLVYGRRIKRHISRFDSIGFILLALVLGGIQTILNQGNDFDWFGWSWFLFGLLVMVIVALPCFIIWELGERHPAINLRLFAYRNYSVAVICSVLGFLVIQGLLSVFAVQLQLLLGYSSSLAGLVYLSMIFLSVPLVAIIHELCRKFDVRLIACLNFLGFAAIMMWIGLFDKIDYFDQIVLPMTFFGLSLAAFFTPLAALAMHDLPGRQLIRAAEELTLLRTMAGAMGITLMAVVQFRRAPFHQLDLADHFGGRRFASLDLLSEFSDRLQASGFSANMARSQLGSFIRQEASLLAMNDAFLLGAFVFVMLAAFVWLARSTITPTKPIEKLRDAEAEEMMEQG